MRNFEKNGNTSKNGLYNKEKQDPKPVIKIKANVVKKKRLILSGFFNKAPIEASIKTIKPK